MPEPFQIVRGSRRRSLLLASSVAAGGLLLAACGSSGTSPTGATGAAPAGGSSGASSAAAPSSGASSSGASSSGAALRTASTGLGTVVVDAQGRTVYMFAADTAGSGDAAKSACTGTCLTYWPVVQAPADAPASLPGISGRVGVLHRSDGVSQLTLAGWPLYTFAGDSMPGTTAGEGKNGFGGLWWALSPAGDLVKNTGSSGAPASGGSSGSSGSGSSGKSSGGSGGGGGGYGY